MLWLGNIVRVKVTSQYNGELQQDPAAMQGSSIILLPRYNIEVIHWFILYYIEIFQLLYPAVDQLLVAESKLQLAVTHVVSALNSSIASLEEILQILDKPKGINTKM